LVVVFLFRDGRHFLVDDFVDDDFAVVGHRRAESAERARGEKIVVGCASARRSGVDERCGVVELFLFFFGLLECGLGRFLFDFGFFVLDRQADPDRRRLRKTVAFGFALGERGLREARIFVAHQQSDLLRAFADVVVGWFTSDPAVAPLATLGLRIVSGGFSFYAAGYVLTQSFNGAGDTLTPTLINLGCFWMFEIPLSYVLGLTLGYGPAGVFWAMAVAFSLMSLVSAWLFRRGTWKLKRV